MACIIAHAWVARLGYWTQHPFAWARFHAADEHTIRPPSQIKRTIVTALIDGADCLHQIAKQRLASWATMPGPE